jgi:hypothetical protein
MCLKDNGRIFGKCGDSCSARERVRRLNIPNEPEALEHLEKVEPEVYLARVQAVTR